MSDYFDRLERQLRRGAARQETGDPLTVAHALRALRADHVQCWQWQPR